MNYFEIKTVLLKELLDISRDWKQLLLLLAVPSLMLPLTLLSAHSVAERNVHTVAAQPVRLGVEGDFEPIRPFMEETGFKYKILPLTRSEAKSAVEAKRVDVALSFPEDFKQQLEDSSSRPVVKAFYQGDGFDGFTKKLKVDALLASARANLCKERLEKLSIVDRLAELLPVSYRDFGPGESEKFDSAVITIFMLLGVAVVTGSLSLDMITGERERGTFALLVVTATSNQSILCAKLIAVVTAGVAASMLTCASLLAAMHLDRKAVALPSLDDPHTVLLFFLASIPLVFVVSSLFLLVSCYSSNFQQGQGYFSPLVLILLALTAVPLFSGADLAHGLAFVPVASAALSLKDVLSQTVHWPWFSLSSVVSLACTALILWLAVTFFDDEGRLFQLQTAPERKVREGLLTRELLFYLSAIFLAMFYAGQSLEQWNFIAGMAITQVGIVFLPGIFFVRYLKLPLKSTLSLNRPTWRSIFAALVLAPGTAVLGSFLMELQNHILPMPQEFAKLMNELILSRDHPLFLVLLTMAVLPGIAEETMFRGVFMGLLKARLSKWRLALLTGAMFGLFHLSLFRFLTTAILGVLLSLIVISTGSIFPAMVLHALHNGLSIATAAYKISLSALQLFVICTLSLSLGSWLMFGKGSEVGSKS